jgi:hypothetical protein
MTTLTARAEQLIRELGLVQYIGLIRVHQPELRECIEHALRDLVEAAAKVAEDGEATNGYNAACLSIAQAIRRELLG